MSNGWNKQSTTRSRTQRQLNDPYVAEAQRLGYRSRAAFKLIELDEKYGFLKGAQRVVDLGCAPGGWCQVLTQRLSDNTQIVGIDLQEVEPVHGADIWVMDFLEPNAEVRLMERLKGPVDVVLSDMANSATGHKQTDHIRTMALCEAALDFAIKVLAKNGTFVSKVLQGGSDNELMKRMQQHFTSVKHAKPPASRQDSVEWFVVAKGFKGRSDQD
jgi:23S rRNA (uridine2552-2'-O)-methyltransferase